MSMDEIITKKTKVLLREFGSQTSTNKLRKRETLCTGIKKIYGVTERGLGNSADENVCSGHLTPS